MSISRLWQSSPTYCAQRPSSCNPTFNLTLPTFLSVFFTGCLGHFLPSKLVVRPIEIWFWCATCLNRGSVHDDTSTHLHIQTIVAPYSFYFVSQAINCCFGKGMTFKMCLHSSWQALSFLLGIQKTFWLTAEPPVSYLSYLLECIICAKTSR